MKCEIAANYNVKLLLNMPKVDLGSIPTNWSIYLWMQSLTFIKMVPMTKAQLS